MFGLLSSMLRKMGRDADNVFGLFACNPFLSNEAPTEQYQVAILLTHQ